MEWWRYELPGPVLRERKPIKLALETSASDGDKRPTITYGAWPAAGGTVYAVTSELGGTEARVIAVGPSRFEAPLDLEAPLQSPVFGAAMQELFAVALASGSDAHVLLFDNRLTLRAQFRFPATTPPRLRFCGADLVIAADGGRLAIFDTNGGALRTVAAP